MVSDDFMAHLKAELTARQQARLDEFTCPECRVLAAVSDDGHVFCGICGHSDFPPLPTPKETHQ